MDDDLDLGATLKGFSPGEKLSDRYALERILGKGGMGVVWLVKDEELKREIAMKFLPDIVVRDREATADLKRETRRSLELTHANIVRIYDFVQGPNWAGITMERIDGETLSAMKVDQPGGCFDVDQIAPWIEQLCMALSYAHVEARVVHRDLKPSNLMLAKSGKIKVADFGIAGTLTESMSRVSVRPTTSGTLVYMSPQQAMGEPPAVTDDLYSIGATIYDLLTGKPPFYSGDVVRQLREKEATTMTERRSRLQITGKKEIPQKWEDAVAACLNKDAAQRPQSVAEFGEMLFGPASPAAKRLTPSGPVKKDAPTPIKRVPQTARATPATGTTAASGAPQTKLLAIAAIALIAIVVVAVVIFHGKSNNTNIAGGSGATTTPTATAAPVAPTTPAPTAAPAPAVAAATPAAKDLEALDPSKVQQMAQAGNIQARGLLAYWYANGYRTQQDYKQALTLATQAAQDSNNGDPIGEFTLAWLYCVGNGVPQNLAMASSIAVRSIAGLQQLAAQGVDAAGVCLGGAYEAGLGMPQDLSQALSIFQKLSDQGYPPAQTALGWMYASGEGVTKDWQQAASQFQRAADSGDVGAMLNLALMYANGKGVMEDPQKALACWQQAASAGNPVALENLGRIYRIGDGVAQDYTKAISYYQAAANQGDGEAMSGLAWMYSNGEGVTADPAKATELLQQATLAGYSATRAQIAVVYGGSATAQSGAVASQVVGTWVAAAANSQAQTMRLQVSSNGKYSISGLFADSGVANGSNGLMLMASSAGNEQAEVAYEVSGNTMETYGPLGPAQWRKVTSSDTADDEDSNSSKSNSSSDQGESSKPSTGQQVLDGFMRSRGYGGGGYGGYGGY
ncbi:MAG: serine/threonine-protein kinase [Chthoniobacteraceae bacterium]|jgi:TPR repeat protein/serine/threonine protein kinase